MLRIVKQLKISKKEHQEQEDSIFFVEAGTTLKEQSSKVLYLSYSNLKKIAELQKYSNLPDPRKFIVGFSFSAPTVKIKRKIRKSSLINGIREKSKKKNLNELSFKTKSRSRKKKDPGLSGTKKGLSKLKLELERSLKRKSRVKITVKTPNGKRLPKSESPLSNPNKFKHSLKERMKIIEKVSGKTTKKNYKSRGSSRKRNSKHLTPTSKRSEKKEQ